jgi:hypothetical protein
MKIFESDTNKKNMVPEMRVLNEIRGHKKLQSLQGRGVPRDFGLIIIDGCVALVLQHVDGVTLDKRVALHKDLITTSTAGLRRTVKEMTSVVHNLKELIEAFTLCGVKADIKASNILCDFGF